MTYIDDQITKTRALLQPRRIDPLEKQTAGIEEETLALPSWTPAKLVKAVLYTLFLWGVLIAVAKQLVHYIVALVEP